MMRARKLGVLTPVLLHVELESSSIYMQQIEGHSIKTLLMQGSLGDAEVDTLMSEMGKVVAVMHDGGLVHGDLTTSNMMVRTADGALVVIDFGLSYNSIIAEDKAVDLYVLERAITSAHAARNGLFDKFLASYKKHSSKWSSTLNRFADVRSRGRKRTMVG